MGATSPKRKRRDLPPPPNGASSRSGLVNAKRMFKIAKALLLPTWLLILAELFAAAGIAIDYGCRQRSTLSHLYLWLVIPAPFMSFPPPGGKLRRESS